MSRTVDRLSLFLFNNPETTEIYTLSLHDALPIWRGLSLEHDRRGSAHPLRHGVPVPARLCRGDRKSTRLNSSHRCISYAVFCLKKKKIKKTIMNGPCAYSPARTQPWERRGGDQH